MLNSEISDRLRGYLPVIVDIETGGFNSKTDAILEIAAMTVGLKDNFFYPDQMLFYRTNPFEGANVEKKSLEFTGIRLNHPLRMAISEKYALNNINKMIKKEVEKHQCKKAILVGHNANFDLNFWNAGCDRNNINSVFHPFSVIDTVSLGALAYGQTVLSKTCLKANIDFDINEAHCARYDVEKTVELFCKIFNKWHPLYY